MICPRCGNQWDASRSPCTRCGLVIRLPNQSGPLQRVSSSPINQQPNGTPPMNNGQPSTASRGSTAAPNRAQPSFPALVPETPWPPIFPSTPLPETPPFTGALPSMAGFENSALNKKTPRPPTGANFGQERVPGADILTQRNVPQRPQFPQGDQITDFSRHDMQRQQPMSQPPLRANRLVTDPLARDEKSEQPQPQQRSEFQQASTGASQPKVNAFATDASSLTPGSLLRGGRYRLYQVQGRQEWLSGVYEAMWIAQDALRGGSQVMICELVLPESDSVIMQSTLRTATMALTSIGRHPHIPTLWDAFSDRGRSFFVFEPIEGESILSRLRRTGRAMQEQDVIECCLQMTEVLEVLAQQTPPLVHGLISPEHIMIGRSAQYALTNFSIVLAGGATQFIAGIDRTRLSPYTAPEFLRGIIDVRSDLYALMATAYHAVTGSAPATVSGSIPQAQRLNPNVSPQLDMILAKGLRPVASQRYQYSSELRQDLLAIRSVSGTLVPGSEQRLEPMITQPVQRDKQRVAESAVQGIHDSVAQTLQSLVPADDPEEQKLLLPRPEELPPLAARNDIVYAALWLVGILVCLLVIVMFARGLF